MDSLEVLSVWHSFLSASYAEATAEGYWNAVIRFFAAHPMPVAMVSEATVAAWLESFPYRSARRVTYYHALRNLFRWALRNGHVAADPTADIRVQMPEEKEPRALTIEQYVAVREAAYAHSRVRGCTVELLYHSAGRIGECCSLTWDRVTEHGIIFAKTKGGRERLIPWSPGLRRAVEGLRSHFGEQDRVLPRAEQTVWLWVREAGRAAGIERVHPHLFRATSITEMSRRGAEIPVIAKIAGHQKVTTTQRYRAVDLDEKVSAVQLLDV